MRAKAIGLSLLVCAIAGLTASTVRAAGPVWWEAGNKELGANAGLEAFANLTNIKFKVGTDVLVCTRSSKATGIGEVKRGNPGTDRTEIEYSGCSVEGFPNCVTKPIKSSIYTLLAYPEGGANGTKAVDVTFPQAATNVLFQFTLENKSPTETCVANGNVVTVRATGTEIEIPTIAVRRKCGAIGKLGIVEAGAFKETKGNEIAKKGALRFPEPAITTAEYYNPTAAKFESLSCRLEATTVAPCLVLQFTAQEVGDVSFAIEVGEKEFGWEI